MKSVIVAVALTACALGAAPSASAGMYKLVPAGAASTVGRSDMVVTPSRDWNHLGQRVGRNAESWTNDGLSLDDVTFYGGIANDQTLFKEVNQKDKPLPRFSATMLPPDIVQMFEASYRIANDTSLFTVNDVEPVTFMGAAGVQFSYRLTSTDEVERNGMATAAVINGKLYMITFEAPVIYYYDRYLSAYQDIVKSAALKTKP
jgi:hypothetical protein